MSRTTFLIAAAAAALLLQVATSNAQSKSKFKSQANSSSAISELAKSRDPAGNYARYPDWARFALSPNSGRGGR